MQWEEGAAGGILWAAEGCDGGLGLGEREEGWSAQDELHIFPNYARIGETWGQHIQAEEERGLCSEPGQELTQ